MNVNDNFMILIKMILGNPYLVGSIIISFLGSLGSNIVTLHRVISHNEKMRWGLILEFGWKGVRIESVPFPTHKEVPLRRPDVYFSFIFNEYDEFRKEERDANSQQ